MILLAGDTSKRLHIAQAQIDILRVARINKNAVAAFFRRVNSELITTQSAYDWEEQNRIILTFHYYDFKNKQTFERKIK
jgi:hypothetical protein